jgi:AcrR family transcriptional regulator
MSPRRYAMGNREESFIQTNQRIVEAAKGLHAERGVLDTSWQDIAERAGVSPVTVYRHFRSLSELIPACARSFVDSVAPLSEEDARAAFSELVSPFERLEMLIRDDCACYTRGREWFHAAMRESDLVPELGAVVSAQQATLAALIRAALEDHDPSEELVSALQAVIDFPFWRALIEAGVAQDVAPRVMLDLCLALLTRYGLAIESNRTPV